MKEEQTTVISERVSKTHCVAEIAVPALWAEVRTSVNGVCDEAWAARQRI